MPASPAGAICSPTMTMHLTAEPRMGTPLTFDTALREAACLASDGRAMVASDLLQQVAPTYMTSELADAAIELAGRSTAAQAERLLTLARRLRG